MPRVRRRWRYSPLKLSTPFCSDKKGDFIGDEFVEKRQSAAERPFGGNGVTVMSRRKGEMAELSTGRRPTDPKAKRRNSAERARYAGDVFTPYAMPFGRSLLFIGCWHKNMPFSIVAKGINPKGNSALGISEL